MGRPGGFFKKLKGKQKRAASRTQRGSKGASKEDRAQKRHERAELYAARREAEQLDAVSNSSEDEFSTDSEAEERRQTKSLRKLRQLLGAAPGTSSTPSPGCKRARPPVGTGCGDDEVADETKKGQSERGEKGGEKDDSAISMSHPRDSEKSHRLGRQQPRREAAAAARSSQSRTGDASEEKELDGEDWRLYLCGEDDDEDEEADGNAEVEFGDADEEADDFVEKELLESIDATNEDEDAEEEQEAQGSEDDDGANPLFDLANGSDDDDDGADLFADAAMMYDGGEEEEDDDEEGSEEEEEKEEAYIDDDDDSGGGGGAASADRRGEDDASVLPQSNGERTSTSAHERLLLENFTFHTSSVSVLQQHSNAGGDGSIVLSEKDEWVRKYHLDLHGTVDETPLQPMTVSHAAQELLAHSNDPMRALAAKRLATIEDKKQLGVFFVSPEEYDVLHPENITILASTHAQRHLQHPPFEVEDKMAAPSTSGAPWTQYPPYLHTALWAKWCAFRTQQQRPLFTVEERGLLDLLQGYADLLDSLHCWQNSEARREVYALHILNHWFKARSVVLAHDALLRKRQEERRRRRRRQQQQQQQHSGQRRGTEVLTTEQGNDEAAGALHPKASRHHRGTRAQEKKADRRAKTGDEEGGGVVTAAASGDIDGDEGEDGAADGDLELRDRGFSKTRLCVMCPLRNHAYKFVYTLVSILQADPDQCPQLAMFEQDFTEIEEAVDPTFRRRPRDYQRAFEGNIDDSFCVGLRLEPERVHVYAHPLNSDLLLCSPLGLRRRIEKNGDVLVSLSSIEVCLIDDAQMLFQQNWMHVTAVLELLNKRPTDTTHGLSDLRRVYAWALEGKSGRHRQTIMSTDVCNATMLSTFRTASVNNSGKLLLQRRTEPGVLARVLVPVRQHFIRFEPTSLSTVDDDRFDFFTKQVYASKISAMVERDVRTIIFVPSYFDFVRVRNFLHREYRESYAALSEYTSLKQQRVVLGQFSDLERPVLLVTERFYYFKRYFVKFAEVLIFYSPPMFPEYYASLTNRLAATSPNAFTMTVYCRYDTHELNRLVGTNRMVQLLERDSGVFSFLTSSAS